MDLIDRQALIEHLKIHCDGCGEALHCAFEAPTVDAVPVVHGRCKKSEYRTEWYEHEYTCVRCGAGMMVCDVVGRDIPPNFCPNCGAKMDGGAEDG